MSSVVDEIQEEERLETQQQIARRMLTDKYLSIEKIAEYSGLSLEEVKKMQNENNG